MNILYISTNSIWSGSEELWSRSAQQFINKGYTIAYAIKYVKDDIITGKAEKVDLNNWDLPKHNLLHRVIKKIIPFKFNTEAPLKQFIAKFKPTITIVSQGNNIDSLDILELLQETNTPFVTITQLVAEVHYLWLTQQKVAKLQAVYLQAKYNFFVSENNLNLNNTMLATVLPNAVLAYNPCIINETDIPAYPLLHNSFAVGLVGRIECFHKGYDMLLDICKQDKWKNRPITFNIYGSGPHTTLLKANCKLANIRNIVFRGYVSTIASVWKENQILLLPSRMEGQALALIEAMFCQRAAIVTNVGGAAELINHNHNGFVASAPTVLAIDAALEEAWQQRHNWQHMGKNASKTLANKYPKDTVLDFNNKILSLLN